MANTLAVYDRADPAAARVIIVAGSDFVVLARDFDILIARS